MSKKKRNGDLVRFPVHRAGASTVAPTRKMSELVKEMALRLLKDRDQAREQHRADVQAGFDQLAQGEGRAHDKTSGRQLAERIKSRGRTARTKKP